jgi:hypothetical protein
MANKDFNIYIKKSHIKAVEKFNEELKAWAKEAGEEEVTLYENLNTSFTLSNPIVENGWLKFNYDGKPDSVYCVLQDDLTGEYYEDEGIDGIMDYVKYWRACLKRAKKYWEIDPDILDRMAEADDCTDDEDEED